MIKLLFKAITVMLSVIIACPDISAQTIWNGAADTEWEGDGSESSPYLIGSAAQLAGLAKRTNANESFEGNFFKLTADIWLSDPDTPDENKPLWDPIGMTVINNGDSEDNPGGFWRTDYWFKGHFDGDGHTIHNLWYAHDSDFLDNFDDPFNDGTYDFEGWSKALFGNIDGATICNLKLENANIQCKLDGAALACLAKNSTITDISVGGMIICGTQEQEGGSAGGLVAKAEETTFIRCYSEADVRAVSAAGGLAASLTSSVATDCNTTGRIASMRNAGGMVGYIMNGSLYQCHSSADLFQLTAKRQGDGMGGFAAAIAGAEVKCCSATGSLKVEYNGYGFAGNIIDNAIVESCYAVCDIVKDGYAVTMASFAGNIGADHLVGYDPVYGYVRNCYSAAKYSYMPCPPDVITTGNHIGGFANYMHTGSMAVNCFYNSDTAKGINSIQPSDGQPQPLWFEFGISTEYMQSQDFVDQLNEMAAIIGASLWKYNPGDYPTPTGIQASPSIAPFDGGNGSQAAPWRISSKQNLIDLALITNHGWTFENQFIEQTADIALNAPKDQWGEQMPDTWTPIGVYSALSGRAFQFHGNYNGNLHSISNMYIENNVANYAGLFGVIGDGAYISNLGVTGAYICNSASDKSVVSGILAGAAGLFNDESYGERHIDNCWTSGYNESFASSGIIGGLSQHGKTIIRNCYTTASILSTGYRNGGAFVADEFVGDSNVYLSASYFNGNFIKNGYSDVPSLFNMCNVSNCFFAREAYPTDGTYQYYNMGREAAYMNSPEFVNELSYASAAAGAKSPWKYTAGSTASFFGAVPSVEVTYIFNDMNSVSFLALEGSRLTPPVAVAPEDGLSLRGWYNVETSDLFDFDNTPVSAPISLHAVWNRGFTPDYSPFKNKFATTYHIRTPEQLLAFANIVNGNVDYDIDGVQQNFFENYTIVLDNDIEWNPIADFDYWGYGVTPIPFRPVGIDGSSCFKGTFDGKGHCIIGLYVNESQWTSSFAMFTTLHQSATVQNLILKNTFVEIGATFDNPTAAMLAASSNGTIYRCGAEGKIFATDMAQSSGYVGGLVARTNGTAETTTLRECYAVTEAKLKSQGFGGLIYTSSGDLHDCYARSTVKMSGYGSFAGLVTIQQASTTAHTSWCESELDWAWNMDLELRPGGAVFGSLNQKNSALYYDRTVLADAFGPEDEWIQLPSWQNAPNPYTLGSGLSHSDMLRMDSKPEFDFSDTWGRRNDINQGYPYLRWTAPGLENDADESIKVETVTIDKSEFAGKPGDTVQLTATISPENASEKSIVWNSSDENIASVSQNGFVTLIADGEAIITATAAENSEIKAVCLISVESPQIPIESIEIVPAELSLFVGETSTEALKAIFYPLNATNVCLRWESMDPSVATIDDNGFVTGIHEGQTEIIVRADGVANVSAHCSVNVSLPAGSGIDAIEINDDSDVIIWSLQGSIIFRGRFSDAKLLKGIYILRQDNGKVSKVIIK